MATAQGMDTQQVRGTAGFFVQTSVPTVGDIVGQRQGALMDAILAYNEAVDAARVLEPHVERVKLVIDFLDETKAAEPPVCEACGERH
jgi:hypothetical protein